MEETTALRCVNHPNTETYLRCGKCGQPICVRCTVMTPVGARCRACARPRRLPVFEMSPRYYVRAILAAIAAAAVGGSLAAYLRPVVPLAGLLLPLALGYVAGEVVSRAANRKRATPLKVIAALGVVVALVMQTTVAVVVARGIPPDAGFVGQIAVAALLGLIGNPFTLLGAALGVVVAVSRI